MQERHKQRLIQKNSNCVTWLYIQGIDRVAIWACKRDNKIGSCKPSVARQLYMVMDQKLLHIYAKQHPFKTTLQWQTSTYQNWNSGTISLVLLYDLQINNTYNVQYMAFPEKLPEKRPSMSNTFYEHRRRDTVWLVRFQKNKNWTKRLPVWWLSKISPLTLISLYRNISKFLKQLPILNSLLNVHSYGLLQEKNITRKKQNKTENSPWTTAGRVA